MRIEACLGSRDARGSLFLLRCSAGLGGAVNKILVAGQGNSQIQGIFRAGWARAAIFPSPKQFCFVVKHQTTVPFVAKF